MIHCLESVYGLSEDEKDSLIRLPFNRFKFLEREDIGERLSRIQNKKCIVFSDTLSAIYRKIILANDRLYDISSTVYPDGSSITIVKKLSSMGEVLSVWGIEDYSSSNSENTTSLLISNISQAPFDILDSIQEVMEGLDELKGIDI